LVGLILTQKMIIEIPFGFPDDPTQDVREAGTFEFGMNGPDYACNSNDNPDGAVVLSADFGAPASFQIPVEMELTEGTFALLKVWTLTGLGYWFGTPIRVAEGGGGGGGGAADPPAVWSCRAPRGAENTGWGKTAWIWRDSETVIYPDGSRCQLDAGELAAFDAGDLVGEDGWEYSDAVNPPGGGNLVFDSTQRDLVNNVTGARHRWPADDEIIVSFMVSHSDTTDRRKHVRVVCEGATIDPMCGRYFPAPDETAPLWTEIERGPLDA
jgi:hypothetical protein